MADLDKIFNLEFIDEVMQENSDLDEVIEKLVMKAHDQAAKIKTLEQLEGKSIEKGGIVLLKHCPMSGIIKIIKEKNFQKTGKKDFPDFYKKLIQKYIEKYPDEAGALHPFCIVHQAMREIFGANNDMLIRQIACQSSEKKVAISKKGMELANLTEEKVKDMIRDYACAYIKKDY